MSFISSTGICADFAGHLFDHLCFHVLEFAMSVNLLGDGAPVFGDQGRTKGYFQHYIIALWPQGHLDRIRIRSSSSPKKGTFDSTRQWSNVRLLWFVSRQESTRKLSP